MTSLYDLIDLDDVIDSRDIVEAIEELELREDELDADETELLGTLRELVEEIEGYSGDKCADGVTLIAEDHFIEYVKEMLEDCGEIPRNLPSYIEIDWDKTAENIRVDYTEVEIDGSAYWFR